MLNVSVGIQTDDQTRVLYLLSTMTIVEKIFVQVLLNVVGTWLVNNAKYLVSASSNMFGHSHFCGVN